MNLRKRFFNQILIVGIFISFISITLFTGFIFQLTKIEEYKSEITSINQQIENTKLEIDKLSKLENTKDLETSARESLNMIKSGEIIYRDIEEGN